MIGLLQLLVGANAILWFPGSGTAVAKTANFITDKFGKYLGPVLERYFGRAPPKIDYKVLKIDKNKDEVVLEYENIKIIDFKAMSDQVTELMDKDFKTRESDEKSIQEGVGIVSDDITLKRLQELKEKQVKQEENEKKEKKSEVKIEEEKYENYNDKPTYKVELTIKGIDTHVGEPDLLKWAAHGDKFGYKVYEKTNNDNYHELSAKDDLGKINKVLDTLSMVPIMLRQTEVPLKPFDTFSDKAAEAIFSTGVGFIDKPGNYAFSFLEYLAQKIGLIEHAKCRSGSVIADQGGVFNLDKADFADSLAKLVVWFPDGKNAKSSYGPVSAESLGVESLQNYFEIARQEMVNALIFFNKSKEKLESSIASKKKFQEGFSNSLNKWGFWALVILGIAILAITGGAAASYYFGHTFVAGGFLFGTLGVLLGACGAMVGKAWGWITSLSFGQLGIVASVGGIFLGTKKVIVEINAENIRHAEEQLEEVNKQLKDFKSHITNVGNRKNDTIKILGKMIKPEEVEVYVQKAKLNLNEKASPEKKEEMVKCFVHNFAGMKLGDLETSLICRSLEKKATELEKSKREGGVFSLSSYFILNLKNCCLSKSNINLLFSIFCNASLNAIMIKELDLSDNVIDASDLRILAASLRNNFTLGKVSLSIDLNVAENKIAYTEVMKEVFINRFLQEGKSVADEVAVQEIFGVDKGGDCAKELEKAAFKKLEDCGLMTALPFDYTSKHKSEVVERIVSILNHRTILTTLEKFNFKGSDNIEFYVKEQEDKKMRAEVAENFILVFKQYGYHRACQSVISKEINKKAIKEGIIENILSLSEKLEGDEKKLAKLLRVFSGNGNLVPALAEKIIARLIIKNIKNSEIINKYTVPILLEPIWQNSDDCSETLINRLEQSIIAREEFAGDVEQVMQEINEESVFEIFPELLEKGVKGSVIKYDSLATSFNDNFRFRSIEFLDKISDVKAKNYFEHIIFRNNIIFCSSMRDVKKLVGIINLMKVEEMNEIFSQSVTHENLIKEDHTPLKSLIVELFNDDKRKALIAIAEPKRCEVIKLCLEFSGMSKDQAKILADMFSSIAKIDPSILAQIELGNISVGKYAEKIFDLIKAKNPKYEERFENEMIASLQPAMKQDWILRYPFLIKGGGSVDDLNKFKKEFSTNRCLIAFDGLEKLPIDNNTKDNIKSIIHMNSADLDINNKGSVLIANRIFDHFNGDNKDSVAAYKSKLKEYNIISSTILNAVLSRLPKSEGGNKDRGEFIAICIGNIINYEPTKHDNVELDNKGKLTKIINILKIINPDEIYDILSRSPEQFKQFKELVRAVSGDKMSYLDLVKELDEERRTKLFYSYSGVTIPLALGKATLLSKVGSLVGALKDAPGKFSREKYAEMLWGMMGEEERDFYAYICDLRRSREYFTKAGDQITAKQIDDILKQAEYASLCASPCLKDPDNININEKDFNSICQQLDKYFELINLTTEEVKFIKQFKNEKVRTLFLRTIQRNQILSCIYKRDITALVKELSVLTNNNDIREIMEILPKAIKKPSVEVSKEEIGDPRINLGNAIIATFNGNNENRVNRDKALRELNPENRVKIFEFVLGFTLEDRQYIENNPQAFIIAKMLSSLVEIEPSVMQDLEIDGKYSLEYYINFVEKQALAASKTGSIDVENKLNDIVQNAIQEDLKNRHICLKNVKDSKNGNEFDNDCENLKKELKENYKLMQVSSDELYKFIPEDMKKYIQSIVERNLVDASLKNIRSDDKKLQESGIASLKKHAGKMSERSVDQFVDVIKKYNITDSKIVEYIVDTLPENVRATYRHTIFNAICVGNTVKIHNIINPPPLSEWDKEHDKKELTPEEKLTGVLSILNSIPSELVVESLDELKEADKEFIFGFLKNDSYSMFSNKDRSFRIKELDSSRKRELIRWCLKYEGEDKAEAVGIATLVSSLLDHVKRGLPDEFVWRTFDFGGSDKRWTYRGYNESAERLRDKFKAEGAEEAAKAVEDSMQLAKGAYLKEKYRCLRDKNSKEGLEELKKNVKIRGSDGDGYGDDLIEFKCTGEENPDAAYIILRERIENDCLKKEGDFHRGISNLVEGDNKLNLSLSEQDYNLLFQKVLVRATECKSKEDQAEINRVAEMASSIIYGKLFEDKDKKKIKEDILNLFGNGKLKKENITSFEKLLYGFYRRKLCSILFGLNKNEKEMLISLEKFVQFIKDCNLSKMSLKEKVANYSKTLDNSKLINDGIIELVEWAMMNSKGLDFLRKSFITEKELTELLKTYFDCRSKEKVISEVSDDKVIGVLLHLLKFKGNDSPAFYECMTKALKRPLDKDSFDKMLNIMVHNFEYKVLDNKIVDAASILDKLGGGVAIRDANMKVDIPNKSSDKLLNSEGMGNIGNKSIEGDSPPNERAKEISSPKK